MATESNSNLCSQLYHNFINWFTYENKRYLFYTIMGLVSLFYLTDDTIQMHWIYRVILAITGTYSLLYIVLNKINDTYGIEGFEDPNKDYSVYRHAENKRKQMVNDHLRGGLSKDEYVEKIQREKLQKNNQNNSAEKKNV